jgi:hypothetical protein
MQWPLRLYVQCGNPRLAIQLFVARYLHPSEDTLIKQKK